MKRFAPTLFLAGIALVSAFTIPPQPPADPLAGDISWSTSIAGDSVILVAGYADVASAVQVDSVEFRADLSGAFGSAVTKKVAKVAGNVTTARLAWAKNQWGPNQTKGSAILVRVGHTAPGCAPSACWSGQTQSTATWSFFFDATAPAAPAAGDISVESVGLN